MFEFLQGGELVLLLLVVVLLIWGPTRLPQLARGIGKALYEFKRASKGLLEEEEEGEREKSKRKISDEELEEIARRLGIETEGKPRSKVVEEVVREARKRNIID